jgi:L,D-peptidoglycan transpeptidase YkuD (ErfK/YbiS/YcfS/YnhG family)
MFEGSRQRQIIRVNRLPGSGHGGLMTIDGLVLRCQLGANAVTQLKREGDQATPAVAMRLLSLMYRADRLSRPPGWYGRSARAIRANDGWCDDIRHGRYNRQVTLPFAHSHETLWREDGLYDIVGVLDWNVCPRSLGRGSAIFLHIARPDGGPTAGCIALQMHDMRRLLLRLRPGAMFWVV